MTDNRSRRTIKLVTPLYLNAQIRTSLIEQVRDKHIVVTEVFKNGCISLDHAGAEVEVLHMDLTADIVILKTPAGDRLKQYIDDREDVIFQLILFSNINNQDEVLSAQFLTVLVTPR